MGQKSSIRNCFSNTMSVIKVFPDSLVLGPIQNRTAVHQEDKSKEKGFKRLVFILLSSPVDTQKHNALFFNDGDSFEKMLQFLRTHWGLIFYLKLSLRHLLSVKDNF